MRSLEQQPTTLKIKAITEVGEALYTVTLEGSLTAQAGQFVMLWIPRFGARPFTIAREQPITLFVKKKGEFTKLLTSRDYPYEQAWISEPLGTGFTCPETGEHVTLLACDVAGLAALHCLATQLHSKQQKFSFKVHTSLLETVNEKGLDYLKLSGIEVASFESLSDELIKARTSSARVYFSAEDLLSLQQVAQQLRKTESASTVKSIETIVSYFYFACAVGLCGQCEFAHGLLACFDGPVIDLLQHEL